MNITMNLGRNSYDIIVERGLLDHLEEHIDTKRKIMIITDSGVPLQYIDRLLAQFPSAVVYVAKQGEQAKSFPVLEDICRTLLKHHFSRKDLIIALGGGVVGDLAGFCAACYMRGIAFIQIPTTTLAQIDSSIGGKVAINLAGIKNSVGAFYQPKKVLIDPNTLATLPKRHYQNGLVEALKAGLIQDASLFALFEQGDLEANIETIITKALLVKKRIVEQDEKEQGQRKLLNFGHTIGHAIESGYRLSEYYHGECVAFGMLYFISDPKLRERLRTIYERMGLPNLPHGKAKQWLEIMRNDKKADGEQVESVWVDEIGKARIQVLRFDELAALLEKEQ